MTIMRRRTMQSIPIGTIRGLDYRVDKFFTVDANQVGHKYYQGYPAVYRCLWYGSDINNNTTDLFLIAE
jgi:hypothetical protein